MNNQNIAYLLAVVCGTFFGASFGMFAHGPDAWAGTGVMWSFFMINANRGPSR